MSYVSAQHRSRSIPLPIAELAQSNLASPPVLAFVAGALATAARIELPLPRSLAPVLSAYLLVAIGLKGGAALAGASPADAWLPILAALALGLAIPAWSFAIARRVGNLSVADAAALAAHYGSVSVVTFTAATAFLESAGAAPEGFLVAILALLEGPGILLALLLAGKFGTHSTWNHALAEVLTGRSIVLLAAGLSLGAFFARDGHPPLAAVFVDPFYLVLVLFLVEMGRTAVSHLPEIRRAGPFLLAFGIAAPLVHGTLGVALGTLAGLSVGGAAAFGVIAASASYIAAPAAVRQALPAATPGLGLAAALGVTFPFNLIVGIPLFHQLARLIA